MAGRKQQKRRGVAILESAIVLTTLLILLVGILDLGIATYRYNVLAEAARRLTREAIVRGEKAAPEKPPWGPAEVIGTASDNSPSANLVRPFLNGFDLSEVAMNIVWLDGSNESESRVRVALEYSHYPIMLLHLGEVKLRAVSTMRIVH